MATITVKDIPDALYEALKKKAAEHHRSVNREVIHCIEEAVTNHKMSVDEIIAEARALHASIGPLPAIKESLEDARNEGRKGFDQPSS